MIRKLSLVFILVTILFLDSNGLVLAVTCSPPSLIPPNNTCSTQESVTVTATVPDSTVTFSGVAPVSSLITIRDGGVPSGSTTTSGFGTFSKTIISTPGSHDFALYFTDTSGRTTPETLFENVNLPFHADTPITNIHLPPTIELSKNSIYFGESVAIFGQGAPGSTVHFVVNGNEVFSTTLTNSDYNFLISSGYQIGNNTVYTYLTRTGFTNSINSFSQNLTVSNCRRSDLNCDSHVNLTDFSILMYWWNTSGPTGDINLDGTVSLVDFSIMLFDWTD